MSLGLAALALLQVDEGPASYNTATCTVTTTMHSAGQKGGGVRNVHENKNTSKDQSVEASFSDADGVNCKVQVTSTGYGVHVYNR